MKTIGFCIFFLFISIALLAQRAVSSAKITNESGELINAYIRNSAYEGTPQKFEYSIAADGPFKEITAAEIKRIQFDDGRLYEKHFISIAVINNHYINRSLFDYKDENNLLNGPTLISKLIEGPISLYQFQDKFDHPHFFYSSPKNNTVTLIENKSYSNESGIFYNDQSYKAVVSSLLNEGGCSSAIAKTTTNLNYTKRDFVKAFQVINTCAGGQVVTYTKNKKGSVSASFIAGAHLSKLHTFDKDEQNFPGVKGNVFGNVISPAFGISIDINPSKEVKNYIGSIEFIHQTYKYTTDSIEHGYYKGTATVKQNMLDLNAAIRLLLGGNKVLPFIEGGGNLSYTYKSSIKAEYMNTLYSTIGKTNEDKSDKNFAIGFLVGGGVAYNRLSLHSRYNFNGSYRNVALLLKYRIAN